MSTAFGAADILLPKKADMKRWAVVACDQYTGEPEYWERVEKYVGGAESTLKLILPEVYLEEDNVEERIDRIHDNMRELLAKDFFEEYKNSLVYIERTQSDGMVRRGIVGAIDLEKYDYRKGSTSEVRATEATVPERIPPRLKIREGAQIELPHVMILIDDPENTVMGICKRMAQAMRPLYDTKLMEGGGRITGRLVDGNAMKSVFSALDKLNDNRSFNARYGITGYPTLLYAVGDGNHSLATAKEFYENLKAKYPDKDFSSHPARYALAEIVNLHSHALKFEAIHRIVKHVDPVKLMEEAKKELGLGHEPTAQRFIAVAGEKEQLFYINKPTSQLSVGSLQDFLDDYTARNGGTVDYIHGAQVVKQLARKEHRIGFILPDMKKSELFPTVIKDGALPRKTFSMGHAADKRFYIECKKII